MSIEVVCLGLPFKGPTRVLVEPEPAATITLRDLVARYVAPQFEGDLVSALFGDGGLNDEYVFLVNGRNALGLGGPDSPVEDQAEVVIMPPVGGG